MPSCLPANCSSQFREPCLLHPNLEIGHELIEGQESPIQGWYSEDHHRKCPSPTLIFKVGQARSIFVSWVLYPLPPEADATQFQVRWIRDPSASRLDFETSYSDSMDSISILNNAAERATDLTYSSSSIKIERVGDKSWSSKPFDAA